jgi:hypothetical protein
LKATVTGGYPNLRGKLVRASDFLGRVFIGTVITHRRDNEWFVDFGNGRVLLKRKDFTLHRQEQVVSALQRQEPKR